MNKIKHEVAIVLGLVAAAAEYLVSTANPGSLHDVAAALIPLLAALGIRQNVIPVQKIVGSLPSILPVVAVLEKLVGDLIGQKPAAVSAPTVGRTPAKAKPVAAVPPIPPTPPAAA
jgi:hypothetical protein